MNEPKEDIKDMKNNYVNELLAFKWNEPDKILSLIEPAIILIDSKGSNSIGQSKLGGQPDLPVSISWPTVDNKSMVFMAQINFSELITFDEENLLPKKGIIYFFAYFDKPENEFGSEYLFFFEKEKYRVLYFDGDLNQLKRNEFPKDLISEYRFSEMPIQFELQYQVPKAIETWKYQKLKLSSSDSTQYDKFISRYDDCEAEMILGTPCPIQSAAEYDWAFSYLNTVDYDNPEIRKKVDDLRPEFVNLLSFTLMGRFDKIGISNCYLGIRKEDLKAKKFNKTVFILQDT